MQINDKPTLKLTAESEKVTIPYKKTVYRLYNHKSMKKKVLKNKLVIPTVDLITLGDEKMPEVNKRILCRHPFQSLIRINMIPTHVELLHRVYIENGKIIQPLLSIDELKKFVNNNIKKMRSDHKKLLLPTPYKVSLSSNLYDHFHDLLESITPIAELV